ncbi:hypothetical protein P7C70_g8271, partial [Phenoliferia sp. Uapishka_3]
MTTQADLDNWMTRDFIGYGPTPPNPNWPNGAKIAVQFVLNYVGNSKEEGGERSVEDGDAHAEVMLQEFGPVGLMVPVPGERDQAAETQFEYGSRVTQEHIPEKTSGSAESRVSLKFRSPLTDLLYSSDSHFSIPITYYAVARALERNPAVAKYAEENGHEIASHCFKWMPYAGLTADEEEAYIRKAVLSFQKTSPSGKVPVGWYYGRPSARSAALVAKVYREMGFVFAFSVSMSSPWLRADKFRVLVRHELLYWADTYADGTSVAVAARFSSEVSSHLGGKADVRILSDLPYWSPMPGGEKKEGLVMMPYTLDNNDFKMWLGQVGSDDAFAQHIIDSFTTIRDEGLEGTPKYITIALHARWIGRPGRFQALKRIVEHVASFDDVWFATREQIARHFVKEFPYEENLKV